jgi:hypothetical protein
VYDLEANAEEQLEAFDIPNEVVESGNGRRA